MEAIKNIISLLWQDFINIFHLSAKISEDDATNKMAVELCKEGIIKIPSFIDPAMADDIRVELESLVSAHPKSTILPNGTKFNYRNQDNPDGADAGMLDIFFIENSIPAISTIDQSKLIELLKNALSQEIIPIRVNAYINEGIVNTRTYHIDNTQPVVYKAFLYLSDVPTTNYGAYSFIKGSHRFSGYTYWNLLKNIFSSKNKTTDMLSYNSDNVMHCTGQKGDLILSNQNGIHRGMPQDADKKRVALIFSFLVKSKLSYIHSSAREHIAKSKRAAVAST